ncbi:IS110 family RNA-guided transposase [Flavobacterium hibisci]|uniref:IS110 family transposase n=1 Tax=Flavobacterium hibisci TaxID=1914462 RepID=UPI001CBE0C02|nr:IS110 family transposase [Flavobacterium hibisci]MBZ4044787.1 IS110 family transposase [Flavobacterium hibisci]
MKKYQFYVGIDVSKLKLDIHILDVSSFESKHLIIENDIKSISNFVKDLKKKIDITQTLFCCENTGVYTNHLSSVLVNLQLDLWVVPAIEIKRSKGISRGKTDKSDAKDIAYYSYRNIDKLKLFTLTDTDIQKLKILYTEREKILKSLLLLETTKENKDFINKEIFKEVSKINQDLINTIKNSLRKIETKIKEIIKSNNKLSKQAQLIRTIPGIGEHTSIYLIIATKGFTAFKNWRQFACYSGVAPFEYSSGSSIKGRTKVNNMADKKMKSLLQMCAMTTLKYDPQLKEYYNKKKAEGKNSMLVLNNIRCKLISRIFAVINRETEYINTYKFAS